MNFFGTVMIPTVESGADWADSASVSYDLKNARLFLCNKMTALAHFTRVAIAMPSNDTSTSSSDNIHALSCKTRSMALLRARIADNRITEFSTYHATYLLLQAEAYARNFAPALIHASILTHLLQTDKIQEGFQFVFRTFYYDYQRAVMSQTRLCFDIQHWVPKYFQPFWCRVMDHLPEHASTAEVSQGLDAIVDDADMHSIFVDIRQAQAVLVSPVEGTEYSSDEKSRYCRTFWTWIMARLHHRYLDAAEALEVMPPLVCGSLSTYLRVQAYFSLAAQCYTRICVNVDATSFGRTTIFSANSVILAKLREVLVEYERNTTPADILRYAKIQLWALFVGSYAEQAADLECGGANAEYGWYNTRFARHVRSMGLLVWQDVREVLQNIHHFDGLRPHGSQWFWKTMNQHLLEINTLCCSQATDDNSDGTDNKTGLLGGVVSK
jgi:hypothetical protein